MMGDIERPRGKSPYASKKMVEEEPELTDTVFIRNLARFDTTQETLKRHIEDNFGETVYCLICKDKETGESKGTGFVKFKQVEDAGKCLEQYEDPEHQTKFFLDGRNIFVLPALSRDKINEVKRAVAPVDAGTNGPKNKKKKARHNRLKQPNSEVNDKTNPSEPRSQINKNGKSKKLTSNKKKDKKTPHNKNKVKKLEPSQDFKNKNNNKSTRMNDNRPKPHPNMKTKLSSKTKKKNIGKKTNKKSRGRHSL